MHETDPLPADLLVTDAARRLATLLRPQDITVAVMREGRVQTHIAGRYPMAQKLAVRLHERRWFWCWEWSGPERGSPPELEPMVEITDPAEAARRVANVLTPAPTRVV